VYIYKKKKARILRARLPNMPNKNDIGNKTTSKKTKNQNKFIIEKVNESISQITRNIPGINLTPKYASIW
jgi:hypothetical protein